MGKDDFTGRTNIGAGRRAIRAATQGRTVDVGLAEPFERGVTSQIPMQPVPIVTRVGGEIVAPRPHAAREVPVVVEDAAIGEFLKEPKTGAEIEAKYGLRRGYLGAALRRRYGDTATLRKVLAASMFEASLVMVEHAMLNIEEMTPAQAMLGAKIAADSAINIEKSSREAPKSIDFGQLAELGEGLARIGAFITGASEVGSLEITSEDDRITRN